MIPNGGDDGVERALRNRRGADDAERARPILRRADAIAGDDELGPQSRRRVVALDIVAADELEPPIRCRAGIGVGADICAPPRRQRSALVVACSCLAAASLEPGAPNSFTAGQ